MFMFSVNTSYRLSVNAVDENSRKKSDGDMADSKEMLPEISIYYIFFF